MVFECEKESIPFLIKSFKQSFFFNFLFLLELEMFRNRNLIKSFIGNSLNINKSCKVIQKSNIQRRFFCFIVSSFHQTVKDCK